MEGMANPHLRRASGLFCGVGAGLVLKEGEGGGGA